MEIIVTAIYVQKTPQSLTSPFMVWHRPHFKESINKIALLENFNFEFLFKNHTNNAIPQKSNLRPFSPINLTQISSSLANKAENMVKLKDKKIHKPHSATQRFTPNIPAPDTDYGQKDTHNYLNQYWDHYYFSQSYLDFSDKNVLNGLSFKRCFHIDVVLHSYYSKIKLVLQIHLNSVHL